MVLRSLLPGDLGLATPAASSIERSGVKLEESGEAGGQAIGVSNVSQGQALSSRRLARDAVQSMSKLWPEVYTNMRGLNNLVSEFLVAVVDAVCHISKVLAGISKVTGQPFDKSDSFDVPALSTCVHSTADFISTLCEHVMDISTLMQHQLEAANSEGPQSLDTEGHLAPLASL